MNGGQGATIRAAPFDPDAVVQPRKDKVHCPSYKPTILVNEQLLIVGQWVHPSSELEAVPEVLRQYRQVFGRYPSELLLDALFNDGKSLKLFEDLNIEALCSPGPASELSKDGLPLRNGQYDKRAFRYEMLFDQYRCPENRILRYRQKGTDHNLNYRRYISENCDGCPRRSLCTKGTMNRTIRRYEADPYQERMAEKMASASAQEAMKIRGQTVELGFAELKQNGQMRRFRRCGRLRTAMEFALACVVVNLRRTMAFLYPSCTPFSQPSGAVSRRP